MAMKSVNKSFIGRAAIGELKSMLHDLMSGEILIANPDLSYDDARR